jgi:hypothetical protein
MKRKRSKLDIKVGLTPRPPNTPSPTLLEVLAEGFTRLRTKLAYYLAPKDAASNA